MILPVVSYGNSVLREETAVITPDFPGLHTLIDNMFETMYAASGVGLAAPQVSQAIRLFIVDASPFAEDDEKALGFKKAFINPYIMDRSGEEEVIEEGCLSFPGFREDVARKPVIRIRYQDAQFQHHEEVYSGIVSRIIQHEYDHVEGVLIVDHVSNLRKILLKRRLKELSMGQVTVAYKMLFTSSRRKNAG